VYITIFPETSRLWFWAKDGSQMKSKRINSIDWHLQKNWIFCFF